MKKRTLLLACVLSIALLLGCHSNADIPLPAGLNVSVPELPAINDFSGTQYEDFEHHFPPILSAVYRHDGAEELVAADDPRLIRLLNFLAFSHVNILGPWRQGYVEENEINKYLAMNVSMLEITFLPQTEPRDTIIAMTPKIVVCGDCYLIFGDASLLNNGMEGVFAEQYWPYGTLVMERYPEPEGSELLSYDGWGTECWLDILKYAGF